jgi:hypothetical protein
LSPAAVRLPRLLGSFATAALLRDRLRPLVLGEMEKAACLVGRGIVRWKGQGHVNGFLGARNVASGILVHSTYSLPDGFIVASESLVDVDKETQTGGHVVGKIQIVSGIVSYQVMTGTGAFDGDCGDKSSLKGPDFTTLNWT